MTESQVIASLRQNGVVTSLTSQIVGNLRASGKLQELLSSFEAKMKNSKHLQALSNGNSSNAELQARISESIIAECFEGEIKSILSVLVSQEIANSAPHLRQLATQAFAPSAPP